MVEVSTFAAQEFIEHRYANMLPTNGYSDWGMFYKIINYCNHVIENAPAVLEADPTFTQEALDGFVGAALAVRAWMYLNLARIRGDVPIKLTYTASRPEARRVGKGCVHTCRFRWAPA